MACGKTAVGRALARRLGRPFVDADRELEKAAGLSIPRLFAARGEAYFRALETRIVRKLARRRGLVVALGGGAVLKRENVSVLRRSGTVVYLQAPFAVLWKRGRRGRAKRPLWSDRRGLERRLKSRRPLYRRAAHVTVRAAEGGPKELAIRIVTRLK